MKNILKQSEVWVTKCKDKYKNNPFLLARLKLTLSYTVGVSIIVLLFSVAIYTSFAKNISENLEYNGTQQENANIELLIIDKAQDQLQSTIITIDILILLFIALMAYYLAGKTLGPIQLSYNRQKKFIADTAHELRTPLAVMKTGAEATLLEKSIKKKNAFIRDSIEEIDKLSHIVSDLLLLAKSDNIQKPDFTKVDIGKLAHKVIKHMHNYATEKKVTLKLNVENTCMVNGNAHYLKRLFTNLIQNAIDYNKVNGKVNISLKKINKQIELKVADTGIGISKNDVPHIFDRFYKTDKARTNTKTSGLGLSIVKEIVQIHDARISIASIENESTTVMILFPCG